nr:hypothetical protein [Tanacetum cinerariifolium]
SQGRNNVKVINMIRKGGNSKRSFEEERSDLTNELTFLAIPQNQLTDESIILEGTIKAKKLNDKIPKTVDEMFKRVRDFIRGEVTDGSAEMVRPSQGDKG